jgi:DNA-binding NarL/FixJ family response regulator
MHRGRVFIVDDHLIVLSGIQALIDQQPDLKVVGTATATEVVKAEIARTAPQVAVVDISLSGFSGIELIQDLCVQFPALSCLALTAHEEPGYVRQALAAGAKGFVIKRSAATELLHAIRHLLAGDSYIDPAIATRMIIASNGKHGDPSLLSGRELSVIQLVARGYSNKEISAQLNLSIKTVETYRVRASEKLNLHTRASLVRYAQSNGWLEDT